MFDRLLFDRLLFDRLLFDRLVELAGALARPRLAVAPAVLAAAVLCPAGWWLARALRGSRVLAAASGAALAGAFAVTLARPGLRTGVLDGQPNLHVLAVCAVSDPWPLTPEGLLNVGLLVPFALLAGLAVGRPVLVTAIAVLASAGIETVQAMYSLGVCDSSDLVHNSCGAAAAALLGAAVHHAVRQSHPTRPMRPARQSRSASGPRRPPTRNGPGLPAAPHRTGAPPEAAGAAGGGAPGPPCGSPSPGIPSTGAGAMG